MVLLVIFCLAVAIWNAYLLFTDQTDALAGWIMLAVSLGVLLWNISAARAYRIPTRTVVAGIVIVALLAMTVSAYAGIEPFVEVKATLVESLAGLTTRYDVEVSPGRSRQWVFDASRSYWEQLEEYKRYKCDRVEEEA